MSMMHFKKSMVRRSIWQLFSCS